MGGKKVLSLGSSLLLMLSFFALVGFLKPFNILGSVIWELLFVLGAVYLTFTQSRKKIFRLSVFYAINMIVMIIANFSNTSDVSLAFFVIGIILMSLGFVISVNNTTTLRKSLSEKTIKELRAEVDSAFDNIAASNIKVEKYYGIKPEKKPTKKKAKKKSGKKKTAKKKSKKSTKKKAKKKTSKR